MSRGNLVGVEAADDFGTDFTGPRGVFEGVAPYDAPEK